MELLNIWICRWKIFDFAKVFTPVTENIKENAEKIALENSLTIEYIRKSGAFRKDEKIAEIIEKRGVHEGLVHIFSVLEMSDTYSPWHNKEIGKTSFRIDKTKCLHYYFYFIDKVLCTLRCRVHFIQMQFHNPILTANSANRKVTSLP